MEQIEKVEIKRLLRKGFNPKLISLELNIPIDIIEQCQKEIRLVQSHKKLEQIRERYKILTSIESNEKKNVEQKELSEEENELAEQVIEKIEKQSEEIKSQKKVDERKKIVFGMIKELDKIKTFPLTYEQSTRICDSLYTEEIGNLTMLPLNSMILRTKKIFTQILGKHIQIKYQQTEDEEELKALARKIIPEMVKVDYLSIESVKSAIWRKLTTIRQNKAITGMQNNISENVQDIIKNLVDGKENTESLEKILKEEIQKRLGNKAKNNIFSTEEQERKQILHQIRMVITEQGDKYPIKNPEKTIEQLQKLCEEQQEVTISVVMKNLMSRKKYDEARKFYDNLIAQKDEKELYKNSYLRGLRKEINNAEICNFALIAINQNGTFEEECELFETLDRGLNQGKVNLKDIVLYKKLGKTVTLDDVWPEKSFERNSVIR